MTTINALWAAFAKFARANDPAAILIARQINDIGINNIIAARSKKAANHFALKLGEK